MSKLCFKYKDQEDPLYYYVDETAYIMHESAVYCKYIPEYEIIQKINKNEDEYFDFSKNIIDIGSFTGQYAMLLDFNHNYCFEPNKHTLCLLYANMYLKNKVDNTDVYNVALGDVKGYIKFNGFYCEGSGDKDENIEEGYNLFHIKKDVPITTLDSYNLKNIGFIKIDVEGFEEKVIRGGLMTIISNNYPPILFEAWDVDYRGMTQEKRDSLFNLLKTLGYEIFEYWGDYETHLAVHKTQLKNNQ